MSYAGGAVLGALASPVSRRRLGRRTRGDRGNHPGSGRRPSRRCQGHTRGDHRDDAERQRRTLSARRRPARPPCRSGGLHRVCERRGAGRPGRGRQDDAARFDAEADRGGDAGGDRVVVRGASRSGGSYPEPAARAARRPRRCRTPLHAHGVRQPAIPFGRREGRRRRNRAQRPQPGERPPPVEHGELRHGGGVALPAGREQPPLHLLDRRGCGELHQRPPLPHRRPAAARDAVRIEEFLNYFRYDYPEPRGTTGSA